MTAKSKLYKVLSLLISQDLYIVVVWLLLSQQHLCLVIYYNILCNPCLICSFVGC